MIVYRYGHATPHVNLDVALMQLRRAHDYHCTLLRIERGRRAAERAIRREHGGDALRERERAVEEADARAGSLATAIRDKRKASRRRTETAVDREALVQAHAAKAQAVIELRTVREQYASRCPDCRALAKEARKTEAPEPPIPCAHATAEARSLLTRLDTLAARAGELVRNARHHSGVYWGTYLFVEAAVQASCAMPLYGKDGISPNDPKFPRWDGSGTLQVRFQDEPLPVDAAMGVRTHRLVDHDNPVGKCEVCGAKNVRAIDPCKHALLQIDAPPIGAWDHPSYSERHRRARQAELRMAVDTDGKRGPPILITARLDMDRPLPAGATIAQSRVVVRRRGPFYKWELQLVLHDDACKKASGDWAPGSGGVCAIDVGWRRIGDELRIATVYDGTRTEELRLDAATIRALTSSERIRSDRDVELDSVRELVRRYKDAELAPAWIREAARNCHAWRAAWRFSKLHAHWATHRFEGDARDFNRLEAWWWRDRNLWAQESRARDSSLARRLQTFREWSKRLARTYETLVLEQFDLREVSRRPREEEGAVNETAMADRVLAAVSELRGALLRAAAVHGGRVALVPAEQSTHTCPDCRAITAFDAAEHLVFTCSGCTKVWDQDASAARVHYARWCERPGDAEIVVTARADKNANPPAKKRGAKWRRAKDLRAQKEIRMNTAREVGGNGAE